MNSISAHSSLNSDISLYGTLIGIHNGYLYSANSFKEELKIFRKKVLDGGDWEILWSYEISCKSTCWCSSDSVDAAYGIINDEIFVLVYGYIRHFQDFGLHLFSINLKTMVIVKNSTNYIPDYNFCNICSLSFLTTNLNSPSEICLVPWYVKEGSISGYICNSVIYQIDMINKTFSLKSVVHHHFAVPEMTSNPSMLKNGKMVYFSKNKLMLSNSQTRQKLELNNELGKQTFISAGFYNVSEQLFCLIVGRKESRKKRKATLFEVVINEDNLTAKFTQKAKFPSFPLFSNHPMPRFIIDPQMRMLIWPLQNNLHKTFIFGILSLSEVSYISILNSTTLSFRNNRKLEKKYFSVYDEEKVLGLTQNEIKKFMKIPTSTENVREFSEEN